MSEEIRILEIPKRHIDVILSLLKFSTENNSVSKTQIIQLREIEEHILRQIGDL